MAIVEAMPKARPLPADPEQAAKIIRRRRQLIQAQQAWRKRHPRKANALSKLCMALMRMRRAQKLARAKMRD